MKFKFKPEDFESRSYTTDEECSEQVVSLDDAAEIANEILDKLTGRYELFLTEPQINKYNESSVDIEPFIEHAYKPKA